MLRRLVVDKVHEVVEKRLMHIHLLCHGCEDGMRLFAFDAAELHHTQQKHGFLLGTYLALQIIADRSHGCLGTQLVSHLVGSPHIAVQIEISIGVPDTEMMTKITHEQFLCP